MRCLGRLISLFILVVLLGGAWLYRTDLTRYLQGIIDPISIARRTGEASTQAGESAAEKIDRLRSSTADSVVLTANELATLLREDHTLIGSPALDSVRVELGERRIRMRALVSTAALPDHLLRLWPGTPKAFEEVSAEGGLTPARSGAAEWNLERVTVRGIPLPSDVVARLIAEATGRGSDGRLILSLPPEVTGFRVRPEGVTLYRGSTP